MFARLIPFSSIEADDPEAEAERLVAPGAAARRPRQAPTQSHRDAPTLHHGCVNPVISSACVRMTPGQGDAVPATIAPRVERLSIELTDRCSKACAFCYAGARPEGARAWAPDDVVALLCDCARHGTRAVSFGGGEPLEYPHLLTVLAATRGLLFRSITTNGLLLDGALDALAAAAPEKVHVSVHQPEDAAEVARAGAAGPRRGEVLQALVEALVTGAAG